MEIIIPLPTNSSINTYKELRGYLKQFELAIHHAQKAVENAEETGVEISDSSFICFEHPKMRDEKGNDVSENWFDELQNINLTINLE